MGLGVLGLWFGVWGLGFGVWGLGFRVWGLGFSRVGVWGVVRSSGIGGVGSGNPEFLGCRVQVGAFGRLLGSSAVMGSKAFWGFTRACQLDAEGGV